jgi:hypothetical protein
LPKAGASEDIQFITHEELAALLRSSDQNGRFAETDRILYLTAQAVEVRDLGDVTVADLRLHGRGAGSTVPTEGRLWVVGRWRHGKCVSWSDFPTEADALEAAGLAERDVRADS